MTQPTVQSAGFQPTPMRKRKSLPRSFVAVEIFLPSGMTEVKSKKFIFYYMTSNESFRSDTSRLVSVWREPSGGTYTRVVDVGDDNKTTDILYSGRVQPGQKTYYHAAHSATVRYAEALFHLGCISEEVLKHHVAESVRRDRIDTLLEQRAALLKQCTMLNLRLNKTQLAKIDKHYGTPKDADFE